MTLFSTLNRVKHLIQKPYSVTLFKNSLKNACNTNKIQFRNISAISKLLRKPTPDTYKIKDNIPVEFSMVYRNTMERYLLMAQFFSTACASIVAIAFMYAGGDYQIDYESFNKKPKAVENEVYVYVAALTTLCVILQLMVAKMPLRIYNHSRSQKYILIFGSYMPFSTKRMVCKIGDVTKIPSGGILPWKNCSYNIKTNSGIILLENYFKTPADLYIMLGQQKDSFDEEM